LIRKLSLRDDDDDAILTEKSEQTFEFAQLNVEALMFRS
jgi:hypothetical protein